MDVEGKLPPQSVSVGTLVSADEDPQNIPEVIAEANSTSEGAFEEPSAAYHNYIEISGEKPSQAASILGLVFVIISPFFAILMIDDGGIDAVCGAFAVCIGGLIIGFSIITTIASSVEKWKKKKNLVLEEVLEEAGIPEVPRKSSKTLGSVLMVVGAMMVFTLDALEPTIATLSLLGGFILFIAGAITFYIDYLGIEKAMNKRLEVYEKRHGLRK